MGISKNINEIELSKLSARGDIDKVGYSNTKSSTKLQA